MIDGGIQVTASYIRRTTIGMKLGRIDAQLVLIQV